MSLSDPLGRGANTTLTGTACTVTVAGVQPGTVDLLVFQVNADRSVRSDDDFVFFNQPESPEGAVRLTAGDALTADLTRIPADVETLVVAVALDEDSPGSLADITGLGVQVTVDGTVHQAPATGLSTERAAVLVEIYRRAGEWKLRNVSAGWDRGLPDLVRSQGVTVDDAPPLVEPPAVAPLALAKEPAAAPAAAPVVAEPVVAEPVVAEPADPWAGMPGFTPDPAPAPAGGLDLGKRTGAISLAKGQRVSIEKSAVIVASISWPPATDYDVYALVRYRDGHLETVSQFGTHEDPTFSQTTRDGAVRHTGDVRRGGAGTAQETIEIRMNADILAVLPVVYSAQSNGAGSFKKYKVSMAIDNGAGTRVQVDADNGHKSPFVYTCVPGIVLQTGTGVQVQSLELYSKRMSERRPVLNDDLSVTMDQGARNKFK